MITRNLLAALAAVALASICGRASAQANVNENQSVYLYVDGAAGNDSNPGTESQPFQTINAAINSANGYARQNAGVRIEVQPGVYHEYVQVGWASQNPTLTIEATQIGQAAIDAADVYTGWYQGTGNGNVYTHSFAGLGSNPVPSGWPHGLAPVVYRREMVFVNGAPLTQVMDAAQMQAGTFYVDDWNRLLQIWPASGTDMNSATVEVAARPYTLKVSSRNNVVLRGLVLEHSAGYMNDSGANIYGGSNVLVDKVQATWNNWGGLGIHSTTNVTLQNSTGSYNGAVGFLVSQGKQVLVQYDEADYNNWRGAMGGFYNYGMGGFKFWKTHGATVSQFYAYNNGGQGLWFDTDNRQISVNGSTLSGNNVTNMQIELNYGPISVTNTASCYGTNGLNLVNAENVTFAGDTFYGNGQGATSLNPQFYFMGQAGGRHFTDWETGQYHNVISQNIQFSGNTFQNTAPGEILFGTYLSGNDWNTFARTFSSSQNTWYDSSNPQVYHLSYGSLNLSGWQSLTGQDRNSQWAPASAPAACSAPAASLSDFAMYANTKTMWATYSASNGQAVIPIMVKNYGTGSGVTLSVAGLPGDIQANFAPSSLASASAGAYANGMTTLTLSSGSHHGTVPVFVVATSGSGVHTLQVPVTF